MPYQGINLFARIIARNPKVYVLKIISLAIAFASSTLVILYSLNEFGYDRFHTTSETIYRMVKRSNHEDYSGNRYTTKIPSAKFFNLQSQNNDSLTLARVSILNGVTLLSAGKSLGSQTIHSADAAITSIFSFNFRDGSAEAFASVPSTALISYSVACRLFPSTSAVGKSIRVSSDANHFITFLVSGVFEDFPQNSHEQFNVFLRFDTTSLQTLGFDPSLSGVYLRTTKGAVAIEQKLNDVNTEITYSLQPLPEIYFGRRMIGEEAVHGDSYSIIILIAITGLIILLALANYVILTTLTLPYRAKELAVKKLAGTDHVAIIKVFLFESLALVGTAFVLGWVVLLLSSEFIKPLLSIDVPALVVEGDRQLILVSLTVALLATIAPVILTSKFVRASPASLLGASTITFPKIKKALTVIQLGISMLVLVFALVMKRQITYSLVKEPGRNNDQIIYLNYPTTLTQEGLSRLREGWRNYHPNILDVLAMSHLPHAITSKEISSPFFSVSVDPMFPRFFDLNMIEGNWYRPNAPDSTIVVNRVGFELLSPHEKKNVVGILEDISGRYNLAQKPIKFKLSKAENYNYLFIRILEVDIRRTIQFLSTTFANAEINFLDPKFERWLVYQDRLNILSNLLAIIASVLSCLAMYGLALSFVKEKVKQLAVRKIFGADFRAIALILIKHFGRDLLLAILWVIPAAYWLINELLRNFAYATSLQWDDAILPVGFAMSMIAVLSLLQAIQLSIKSLLPALKN